MSINVILVDDHPIVREGLRQIIDIEEDMSVCAEASNCSDAMFLMEKHSPSVAIIDITLDGEKSGLDLLKEAKIKFPDIHYMVLSMHEESLYAERAIRAGASGYILKKEAPGAIAGTIRRVINGELYLSEGISGKIISKLLNSSSDGGRATIDKLSDREFEVFQMIGNGMTARDIAEKLALSINTIESHKRHIKEKLNLKNSTELVKNAVQWMLTKDL